MLSSTLMWFDGLPISLIRMPSAFSIGLSAWPPLTLNITLIPIPGFCLLFAGPMVPWYVSITWVPESADGYQLTRPLHSNHGPHTIEVTHIIQVYPASLTQLNRHSYYGQVLITQQIYNSACLLFHHAGDVTQTCRSGCTS